MILPDVIIPLNIGNTNQLEFFSLETLKNVFFILVMFTKISLICLTGIYYLVFAIAIIFLILKLYVKVKLSKFRHELPLLSFNSNLRVSKYELKEYQETWLHR
jgi:hypothetical protein